jgi:hypothetical protein
VEDIRATPFIVEPRIRRLISFDLGFILFHVRT